MLGDVNALFWCKNISEVDGDVELTILSLRLSGLPVVCR
jgi:hypothetical protein